MNEHQTLNARAIENRAWQIAELFKVIDNNAPMAMGEQISIETMALLGRQLATELAEYANGDRGGMLGMEISTESMPGQHTIEDVRRSYLQTIEAVEALIRAINAADLKRIRTDYKDAIDDAMHEMMGHCDAARSDFLGGLDHE